MAISRDFTEGLGVKGQYVGKSVSAALSDGCAGGEIEFPTLGYFVKSLLDHIQTQMLRKFFSDYSHHN